MCISNSQLCNDRRDCAVTGIDENPIICGKLKMIPKFMYV